MMKLIVVAVAVLALAAPTAAIDEECKACKAIGVSNQPTNPPRPAPIETRRVRAVPNSNTPCHYSGFPKMLVACRGVKLVKC